MSADLVDRVRSRLVVGGAAVTSAAVAAAVRDEAGGLVGDDDVLTAVRMLQQEFLGAGPLEPLLREPDVTDVLVTGPAAVWADRGDGLSPVPVTFADEDAVRRLAQRLALAAGRRLDDAQPWVDGWLADSASGNAVRMHAVLSPVASAGTCISLRVLRPADHDLAALERLGTFDPSGTHLLRAIVRARLAFLIVGGTGAGKTTLLAAMLSEAPEHERIVCVEDAGELHPRHPHVVRLVTRPPNVEGAGEIKLRDLVRQALRMRPDRLVVAAPRSASSWPRSTPGTRAAVGPSTPTPRPRCPRGWKLSPHSGASGARRCTANCRPLCRWSSTSAATSATAGTWPVSAFCGGTATGSACHRHGNATPGGGPGRDQLVRMLSAQGCDAPC